jgi:hypothetical protein
MVFMLLLELRVLKDGKRVKLQLVSLQIEVETFQKLKKKRRRNK